MKTLPLWKIAATAGGAALTANSIWLNACHVAGAEGWTSPLVSAGIIVTLCAASAPPLAERAGKDGQPLKGVLLWIFFVLAAGFSLTTSISRSAGYADDRIATAEKVAEKAKLARESYEAAQATAADECKRRGPRCRAAEDAVKTAREQLATAEPVVVTNPGAERLAAVLGMPEASIALYSPLMLPLALELGGFILLALGLAPAARCREDESVAIAEAVAAAKPAKQSPETTKSAAKPLQKPVASGNREYYLSRLERDYPDVAKRVAAGELSVHRATIETGLRKPAGKKWTKPADYGIKVAD
jgi:hypothetical protein